MDSRFDRQKRRYGLPTHRFALYEDTVENPSHLIELGRILRGRREQLGLTAREVAEAAGVSTSYVGMLERAERRPTQPHLRAILSALDLQHEDRPGNSIAFGLDDDSYWVAFKPPNRMGRFSRPDDPRQGEMARRRHEILGNLLRRLAIEPARARDIYALHFSGDPEMADELMPSDDALYGEIAAGLAENPRLARRLYDLLESNWEGVRPQPTNAAD